MNWDEDENGTMSLSLAWLGFSDCHSGISHYHLTLGTKYNGRDLIEVRKVVICFVNTILCKTNGDIHFFPDAGSTNIFRY